MAGKLKFDVNLPEIAQCDYRRKPYESVIFPCIQDLLDFLGKFDTSDCFFRGQCELWDVTSSLHRHRVDKERYKKAYNIFMSAIEWLVSNKYISEAINNIDDHAISIAQHYGCPTDLVDITTDYRTASYFAASNNDTHKNAPEGCVWVFPKCELERLQRMMETPPEGLLEQLPKGIVDKFNENGMSALIELNVPQLSRLNAQNGAFLWDMAGTLKHQIFFACIGTRLVFKHTPNEKSVFTAEKGRLFPFPNQLESEIMRGFRERDDRIDGLPDYYGIVGVSALEKEGKLKNGLISDIVDNAKGTVFISLPEYFAPSFGEYEWTQRKISQNDYSIKNIDMSNYIECHLPFSVDGALTLVQHILKSVEGNSLTDLLIMFYRNNALLVVNDGEEEALIEMVINLNNYLYSDTEIAQVVLELVKMMAFKVERGYVPPTEEDFELALVFGKIDEWISEYYGCRTTKLILCEEYNSRTKFWLPGNYAFLEDEYQTEFTVFDKSCFVVPPFIRQYCNKIPNNAEIFIYQSKPQNIMPYDTLRRMFIELILPQQFAFRRPGDRLFIPDYIDKITLPVFGRTIYGIVGENITNETEVGGFYMV